jgi:hypothetical protein
MVDAGLGAMGGMDAGWLRDGMVDAGLGAMGGMDGAACASCSGPVSSTGSTSSELGMDAISSALGVGGSVCEPVGTGGGLRAFCSAGRTSDALIGMPRSSA